MSARATVVLLLLVAAGAAFLWRDADSRQLVVALLTGEQPQPPPEDIVPLVDIDAGDVVGLELRAGQRHFVMERTASGEWRGPLAGGAVEDFLANLGGVGRLSHIGIENRELEEFGLENPERSLLLVPRDPAEPIRVDVGKSNPPTTAVYTRINRIGPIILAGSVLVWEIDKLAARLDATPASANP